jgi:preprotein translocase subunit YajC
LGTTRRMLSWKSSLPKLYIQHIYSIGIICVMMMMMHFIFILIKKRKKKKEGSK